MLVYDNNEYIGEYQKINRRKIGYHEVVYLEGSYSYHWYVLIFLAVFINTMNLLYYRYEIGIHAYLLIGLLILYFRHILTDFLIDDRIFYEVIDEDIKSIYLEYSDLNDRDYLYDTYTPRFEMFTIMKVLLRYLLYVGVAYFLMKYANGFYFLNRYVGEFNEVIVAFILTIAMFVSSYFSYDFDYSDIQYCLNFVVCSLSLSLVCSFLLFDDLFVLFAMIVIVGLAFYCMMKTKRRTLLKVLIIFLCFFFIYHNKNYHFSNMYHTYYQSYEIPEIQFDGIY